MHRHRRRTRWLMGPAVPKLKIAARKRTAIDRASTLARFRAAVAAYAPDTCNAVTACPVVADAPIPRNFDILCRSRDPSARRTRQPNRSCRGRRCCRLSYFRGHRGRWWSWELLGWCRWVRKWVLCFLLEKQT
jgi:hypothetical protein